jgi:hypothetical protein
MDPISDKEIDWTCPECLRLPGQPCDWTGWNYAQPHPEFHTKRWEISHTISSEEGHMPTHEEFMAAMNDDPDLPI